MFSWLTKLSITVEFAPTQQSFWTLALFLTISPDVFFSPVNTQLQKLTVPAIKEGENQRNTSLNVIP